MAPVELSMIAVDEGRAATRQFDRLDESVLTTSGIYGANASGKTNVIDALAWLSTAVRDSLRMWDQFVPRDPFKFGTGPEDPSIYEIELVVRGIRYTYRLELDTAEVHFEGLYAYPERRRRVLFERTGLELSFRRGLGNLAGARELLTPTTLALSSAMRFDESEIRDFGEAVAGIEILGAARSSSGRRAATLRTLHSMQVFEGRDSSERLSALALLRFADLGIDNVEVVNEPHTRIRFLHRVEDQLLPFEMEDESAGTRTWFWLIAPVLAALNRGGIVLFDEIDASLHPRLSARLLELFQSPDTNPHGAQLVFTTHDTSLLNHLNRDEVWLTERDATGATSLTALAEFGGDKVRRSLNLEKAYLQGRFGAVPELDQAALRRALGLTVGQL